MHAITHEISNINYPSGAFIVASYTHYSYFIYYSTDRALLS